MQSNIGAIASTNNVSNQAAIHINAVSIPIEPADGVAHHFCAIGCAIDLQSKHLTH